MAAAMGQDPGHPPKQELGTARHAPVVSVVLDTQEADRLKQEDHLNSEVQN